MGGQVAGIHAIGGQQAGQHVGRVGRLLARARPVILPNRVPTGIESWLSTLIFVADGGTEWRTPVMASPDPYQPDRVAIAATGDQRFRASQLGSAEVTLRTSATDAAGGSITEIIQDANRT